MFHWFFGGSTTWLFCSNNSQDLLRNVITVLLHPTSAVMVRCACPCLCGSTILPRTNTENLFAFAIRRPWRVTVWRKMTWKPYFCADFNFLSDGLKLLISWWTACLSLNAVFNKLSFLNFFVSCSGFFFWHFEAVLITWLQSTSAKCEYL